MQVSSEIRWFFNSAQDELKTWFCQSDAHGCTAGGGLVRVDSYLRDAHQTALGLKHRGGKKGVEIKGLVCHLPDHCEAHPFSGPIELWTKWTSDTLILETSKTVTTEKRRWIRKFDTTGLSPVEIKLNDKEAPVERESLPPRGCSVEYTHVRFVDYETKELIPDSTDWWTLSFEGFGKLDSVKASLCDVAAVMASRNPPNFDSSFRASYPAFLSQVAQAMLSSSHRI